MKSKTTNITRADLSDAVYREVGLPKLEASNMVNAVFERIESSLVSGEVVKLSGFGVFSTREKTGRVGRNPKTGASVIIPPKQVVTFKPSTKVVARISRALTKNT